MTLGNLAQAALSIYKSRKYRCQFTSRATIRELNLMLDWLYFLTLPSVKVVYDVGAADGSFSSGCSKISNIEKVVAFEPNPDMASKMQELSVRSSKSIFVPVAVGAATGVYPFHVTTDGYASSCLEPRDALAKMFPGRDVEKLINVSVETLDEIRLKKNLPYPDVIKIDTQGYEQAVLSGATDVLSHTSFCIVECCYEELYEKAPLVSDIFAFFSNRGWRNVGNSPSFKAANGRPVFADLIFASERGCRSMD